jgi:hypothetical protein
MLRQFHHARGGFGIGCHLMQQPINLRASHQPSPE